jgi:hypothetical protein
MDENYHGCEDRSGLVDGRRARVPQMRFELTLIRPQTN